MILDNEEQRDVILGLFDQANVKGAYLDLIYEVKQAVKTAKVFEAPAAPNVPQVPEEK